MKYYILLVVLGLVLSSCADICKKSITDDSNKKTGVTGILINGRFIIPDEDISHFKKLALNGSLEKAGKLYQYHTYVTHNDLEAHYWLEIGVENGNFQQGVYNLAFKLALDKKNAVNTLRAKFWLENAKKNGDKNADAIIKEVNSSINQLKPDIAKVPLLERKALLGNGKAAIKVADAYKVQNNNEQEFYWTRIAVQNGDKHSIPRLAKLLSQSPDPQDQTRANYWNNMSKKAVMKAEQLSDRAAGEGER